VAQFTIEGELRTTTGKRVNRLRKQGIVPGTIYGPFTEPVKAQFQYRPLEIALRDASSTNVIDVVVDGKSYPSLAREVQRDIIKGDIMHVDFFAPDLSKKLRADIPIILEGESQPVIARKAIMLTGTNTVTVEMLPTNLMDRIIVDLTVLKAIGDEIKVADLPIAEGITVLNEPEALIAKLVQPAAARSAEAMNIIEGIEAAEAESEEGEDEDEGEA
jgi:large subunit ribosomal protein L25